MSRVGKKPVLLPKTVKLNLGEKQISVSGPLGELILPLHSLVSATVENDALVFSPVDNLSRQANAMCGTMRALFANMVQGVTQGFERKLILSGVGYRAQAQSSTLNLSLGYSHPIAHQLPEGVQAVTPSQTEIIVKGINKQQVNQQAADIRAYRRPEPYKGKGIRYSDETVVLKETKKK